MGAGWSLWCLLSSALWWRAYTNTNSDQMDVITSNQTLLAKIDWVQLVFKLIFYFFIIVWQLLYCKSEFWLPRWLKLCLGVYLMQPVLIGSGYKVARTGWLTNSRNFFSSIGGWKTKSKASALRYWSGI